MKVRSITIELMTYPQKMGTRSGTRPRSRRVGDDAVPLTHFVWNQSRCQDTRKHDTKSNSSNRKKMDSDWPIWLSVWSRLKPTYSVIDSFADMLLEDLVRTEAPRRSFVNRFNRQACRPNSYPTIARFRRRQTRIAEALIQMRSFRENDPNVANDFLARDRPLELSWQPASMVLPIVVRIANLLINVGSSPRMR